METLLFPRFKNTLYSFEISSFWIVKIPVVNYVQLKQHKKEWTLGRYLILTLQDFSDELPFTIYTDLFWKYQRAFIISY